MLGSICLHGQGRCQGGLPGDQESPDRWGLEKQLLDVIFGLSWWVEESTKREREVAAHEWNKRGPTSAPIRNWETMKNNAKVWSAGGSIPKSHSWGLERSTGLNPTEPGADGDREAIVVYNNTDHYKIEVRLSVNRWTLDPRFTYTFISETKLHSMKLHTHSTCQPILLIRRRGKQSGFSYFLPKEHKDFPDLSGHQQVYRHFPFQQPISSTM